MASNKRPFDGDESIFRALKQVRSGIHSTGKDAIVALAQNPFSSVSAALHQHDEAVNAQAASHSTAERQRLSEEISRLRRDIAELEDAVRRKEAESEETGSQSAADMQRIMGFLLRTSGMGFQASFLAEGDGGSEGAADGMRQQEMTSQLRSLATFTGIEFTDAHSQVKSSELLGTVRRYTVSGQTYDLPFTVIFDVDEPTVSADKSNGDASGNKQGRPRIMSVEPLLPPHASSELADFVQFVIAERALHTFFRGLVRYAELRMRRSRVFVGMKQRHPGHVGIPGGADGGDTMVVHDAEGRPGLKFMLSWKFALSRDGRVCPTMRLHAVATTAVRQADKTKTLANANKWMAQLVALRGLEFAIESLVACVSAR
eukprot:Opistho-2@91641